MRPLVQATPPSITTTSPPPTAPSTAVPPPSSSGEIIKIALFAGVFTIIILSLLVILCKRKKTRTHPEVLPIKVPSPSHYKDHVITMPQGDHVNIVIEPSPPHCASETLKTVFTYEDLANATQDFSQSGDNILGKGGFGYVHKGVLPNGEKVAVKKLRTGSKQGELEFQTEVAIASPIHHKHIVSLVGHCDYGSEKMLVYEFVPNKTLYFHLHENGNNVLSWDMRMKVAIGIAKGLTYLHDECEVIVNHILMLTEKSDVYSFGVILLELITGNQPVDLVLDYDIVGWAKPLLERALKDGNFSALVDPRLENMYKYSEMRRMIVCATLCVRRLRLRRPSMSQIVGALEGHLAFKSNQLGQNFKKSMLVKVSYG
ncbi:proline-rich receptor-like protein kinase PERK15 [Bidens hawaiensis]|uniref:proline-rich receptor-like protein kinase PERK15 n=1 Tax=Bidens hawaiensis TaxID=980011 RepID=UPI00404A06D8